MSDGICLEVDNKRVKNFRSYTVDANLYTAADSFSVVLANSEIDIQAGMQCKLHVNDKLELTGIIDRTVNRCDKSGSSLTIEGRDLMGLIVDSYCEKFMTVEDMTMSELAESLIYPDKLLSADYPGVPFINRKQIVYQDDLVGKLNSHQRRKTTTTHHKPQQLGHISPGMTIFETLRTFALSQGMLFFSLPDGTFVFGRPMVSGAADYHLLLNKEGLGVNVLSAEKDDNIACRYSKVVLLGQRWGKDPNITRPAEDASEEEQQKYIETLVTDLEGKNFAATIEDPSFPFYKPFVVCDNIDSQSPLQHARLIMEKMRHDGLKLTYTVPGHSQNGKNYTVNKLATVKDEIHKIIGTYLVYSRTLNFDKQSGATTTLRLGPPGLIE